MARPTVAAQIYEGTVSDSAIATCLERNSFEIPEHHLADIRAAARWAVFKALWMVLTIGVILGIVIVFWMWKWSHAASIVVAILAATHGLVWIGIRARHWVKPVPAVDTPEAAVEKYCDGVHISGVMPSARHRAFALLAPDVRTGKAESLQKFSEAWAEDQAKLASSVSGQDVIYSVVRARCRPVEGLDSVRIRKGTCLIKISSSTSQGAATIHHPSAFVAYELLAIKYSSYWYILTPFLKATGSGRDFAVPETVL
jgi:hypothetical protein